MCIDGCITLPYSRSYIMLLEYMSQLHITTAGGTDHVLADGGNHAVLTWLLE